MPSIKEKIQRANKEYYDKSAHVYEQANSYITNSSNKAFYQHLFETVLQQNNSTLQNKQVLELGCGTASFLPWIMSQNIENYIGMDISPHMIDIARSHSQNEKTKFVVASVEEFVDEMMADGRKFDIIFSFSFLHHIYEYEYLLQKIPQLLKSDGIYLAFHEPNFHHRNISFYEKIDRLWSSTKNHFTYLALNSLIDKIWKFFKRIYGFLTNKIFSPKPTDLSNNIDYVDFHLNADKVFSVDKLRAFETPVGVLMNIKTYDYYEAPVLAKFNRKIDNYFYLILRKS